MELSAVLYIRSGVRRARGCREEYAESKINEGARLLGALGEKDDIKSGGDSVQEATTEGTDGSDSKQGVEDEEQDLQAIAREQAERCV